MKFLAPAAFALFASSVAAAPVANAEAAAAPSPGFLSALLDIGLGINLCGLEIGAEVGAQAGIYITPDNRLTYGCTVSGSIPFIGAIVNGNLYVNSPWLDNDGCVNTQNGGEIILSGDSCANLGWYPSGGYLYPNGENIYACPDGHGNEYVYYGGNCENRREIHFRSN